MSPPFVNPGVSLRKSGIGQRFHEHLAEREGFELSTVSGPCCRGNYLAEMTGICEEFERYCAAFEARGKPRDLAPPVSTYAGLWQCGGWCRSHVTRDPMTKTKSKKSGKPRGARAESKRRICPAVGGNRGSQPIAYPHPAASANIAADGPKRAHSKQARMIAMLGTPAGVTIDAMMQATGWQQHSVRGFLAGVIRKRLGLALLSEPGEGGRIYRISDQATSRVTKVKVGKAA